jgi:hydrogenase-4 component F
VSAQAVHVLAKGDGLAPLLASAGLAGLPPFGVFPGMALAILAVARQAPWILMALLPGLAALGWAAIVRLPTPRIAPSDRWSPAWIPMAAALLLGFCMPGPIAEWLRALAREVAG